ncbi:MAG TPA: transposase [Bdellovibrionota bacterium]|nr:transposase [Bdellovibrionota bacterium]
MGRPDHGGDLGAGKRKRRRPLDLSRPIHLVLKSKRARGHWSLLHHQNRARVDRIIFGRAEAHGVKVYRTANVGNHLHLLVKAPTRAQFGNFLRAISALISRAITGAKKGNPVGRFWDALAYTRVIHWGRHFEALKAYLGKNRLEAVGFGGARLRLRPNGEAVVVIGELGPDEPREVRVRVEKLIRGG